MLFVAHVVEEYPSLVPFLNELLQRDITQETFLAVNAFGLMLFVALAAFAALDPGPISVLALLSWISVAMAWNALFHVIAVFKVGVYAPGVITAVGLYVPYSALVVRAARRERLAGVGILVIALLVGGAIMGTHGYLVLFRGERLF